MKDAYYVYQDDEIDKFENENIDEILENRINIQSSSRGNFR
jgi:hypothetical protein